MDFVHKAVSRERRAASRIFSRFLLRQQLSLGEANFHTRQCLSTAHRSLLAAYPI
jgi:hypothetical protein